MAQCFVMQPFDKNKFDRRYHEVFKVAIQEAGLEPYRVDEDPEVAIPIDTIEKQIASSEACFTEITTDNPNVWFELGYAIACNKPVCLVCSNERTTPFPFDIRHRKVIKYNVDSPSDFTRLKIEITNHLKSILRKHESSKTIESLQASTLTQGLTPHELTALHFIMNFNDEDGISILSLKKEMNNAGYTEIATTIATRSLAQKQYITINKTNDDYGNTYTVYFMEDKGIEYLISNQDRFRLRTNNKKAIDIKATSGVKEDEDDLPF